MSSVTRVRSHALRWSAVGALAVAVSGCSMAASVGKLGDGLGKVHVDAEVDVRAILGALFPKLSDAELDELTTKFDLETALELKAELEKARVSAEKFSEELFTTCEERVATRAEDLKSENDGYPTKLTAVGAGAFFDQTSGFARLELNGIFSGKQAYSFGAGDFSVTVGGKTKTANVSCLSDGDPVDLVFLVDVTGSMSNVIDSVRSSLLSFVSAIKDANLQGTISVVTYQDTVGVQVPFQELEKNGYERSPFIAKRDLSSTAAMNEVERFIAKLEANRGADAPENLAGAVDFANNSVIGELADGSPNTIGDGKGDPIGTEPFPKLSNPRRVFVAMTDVTFHSDSRNEANSSLLTEFKPRPLGTIVDSLLDQGVVVHVVDPSWSDEEMNPTGADSEVAVDADYFARATGGIGEDRTLGYSLTDLELVAVSSDSGLLDIALHNILKSSCRIDFMDSKLTEGTMVSVSVNANGETFESQYALTTH